MEKLTLVNRFRCVKLNNKPFPRQPSEAYVATDGWVREYSECEQNGWHDADDILKCILLDEKFYILI